MRAAFVEAVFERVIPTQRGDHIFKMNSREVNCCNSDMSQNPWKAKLNCIPNNTDQILVVYNNEQAQWDDDSVANFQSQPRPQPQWDLWRSYSTIRSTTNR